MQRSPSLSEGEQNYSLQSYLNGKQKAPTNKMEQIPLAACWQMGSWQVAENDGEVIFVTCHPETNTPLQYMLSIH